MNASCLSRRRRRASHPLLLAALLAGLLLEGCAKRPDVGAPPPADAPTGDDPPQGRPTGRGARGGRPAPSAAGALQGAGVAGIDRQVIARQMGLIAGTSLMPFVARIGFFAGPQPDSTVVLLSLSIPNRVLAFVRDGDRYAANYSVTLELRRAGQVVRQFTARELVRVAAFREAARFDESIIFQQYLRLAPGTYAMGLAVKDDGSVRTSGQDVSLVVPRLGDGQLSSVLPVYEVIPRHRADSMPRLLAAPRGAYSFGVDSVAQVHVEEYGLRGPSMLQLEASVDSGVVVWRDSLRLAPDAPGAIAAGTASVPLGRIGVGFVTVAAIRPDTRDTTRVRLLVSLGDDLPVTSFEEMLTYLRYFARADRLKQLREAAGTQRAVLWSQFLKETDPNPATAENEALRDYLNRVRTANLRFREEGRMGWQSDRGTALIGLGEPDNIIQSNTLDPNARGRTETWVYTAQRITLQFVDQTGFGRWRLTPQAQTELQQAINRRLVG